MLDIMPPLPVIADFFGLDNIDNMDFLLGLYYGMIKIIGMDKSTAEKAYKTYQLDKLIHDSYKTYGSSGYYKMFCKKTIIIGKTRLL
jgi:hypothetical protein